MSSLALEMSKERLADNNISKAARKFHVVGVGGVPSDRLFTKRQSHVEITTSPLPTGYLTTTCPIVNTREGVCLTLKRLFHAKAPLPQ